MRRDCPENTPLAESIRQNAENAPQATQTYIAKMRIQILTSISPFKTQNQEGKPIRQRIGGFARPRERRASVRARWLARATVYFTLRAKREAKIFYVFALFFAKSREHTETRRERGKIACFTIPAQRAQKQARRQPRARTHAQAHAHAPTPTSDRPPPRETTASPAISSFPRSAQAFETHSNFICLAAPPLQPETRTRAHTDPQRAARLREKQPPAISSFPRSAHLLKTHRDFICFAAPPFRPDLLQTPPNALEPALLPFQHKRFFSRGF